MNPYRTEPVTRDRLESLAFRFGTQIHIDNDSGVAVTRIAGIEYVAELGETW